MQMRLSSIRKPDIDLVPKALATIRADGERPFPALDLAIESPCHVREPPCSEQSMRYSSVQTSLRSVEDFRFPNFGGFRYHVLDGLYPPMRFTRT